MCGCTALILINLAYMTLCMHSDTICATQKMIAHVGVLSMVDLLNYLTMMNLSALSIVRSCI